MGKHNLNKIPKDIRVKVNKISNQQIVVGCAKIYSIDDLTKGSLNHLGIKDSKDGLQIPGEIVPSVNRGKYSQRNMEGQEVIRKDLPMETYSITFDAPNYGDSSKGTHDVTWTKERYVREHISPALAQIKMESMLAKEESGKIIIKFEVSEILDKKSKDFEKRLLASLNLLQENIGSHGVESAGVKFDDYRKTMKVDWEIFPLGTREEALARVTKGRSVSSEEKQQFEERYDFYRSLKPEKEVYGTSGFSRYFGALIKDELVVFENLQYGNAIYVMHENWQTLSQKSRTELLSGRYGKSFQRVEHRPGWKLSVKKIIEESQDA